MSYVSFYPDSVGPGALTCGVVHHNLALFNAPPGARPREKGQIGLNRFAFKMKSYEALQEAHRRPVAAGSDLAIGQLRCAST
jgi:hypothetical protein